ncbi:MAG: ABC transporter permease [Rhabdaerophilum sp.]
MDKALNDLRQGLAHWSLWGVIGWIEIAQRYRRSVIGPFWITISLGIVILGLSIVYSTIFRQPLAEYLPFVAAGLIVWTFIAALINESCFTFIGSETLIRMLHAPLSVYGLKLVWKNIIILGHNALIYIVILLFFDVKISWSTLMIIPGLFIIAINGVFLSIALGLMSARFRDIPLLIGNLVQMVFFITPILWKPGNLVGREWIYLYNPFFHFIEMLRAPLMGNMPEWTTLAFVLSFTVVHGVLALIVFSRYRWRIAYWL